MYDVRHKPGIDRMYHVINTRTGTIISSHTTLTDACVACSKMNKG